MSFGRLDNGASVGLTRLDVEVQKDIYSDRTKLDFRIGLILSAEGMTYPEMAKIAGEQVTEALNKMFSVTQDAPAKTLQPGMRKMIVD